MTTAATPIPTTEIKEFYNPTIDERAISLENQINVDISSIRATEKRVVPYEGAANTPNLMGITSKMRYRKTVDELIDVDNSYVRFKYIICKPDGGDAAIGAAATRQVQAAFFVGNLINNLRFFVNNDMAKSLCNITQNYPAWYKASILATHSYEDLTINNKPYIAGPVFDMEDVYGSKHYTGADAAAMLANYNANEPKSRKIRHLNYSFGNHATERFASVPLKVLTGASFGNNYPINLSQLDVEVTWAADGISAMETCSDSADELAAAAHAQIRVQSCELIVKSIIITQEMQRITAQKILAGHIDNISFLQFEPRSVTYSGSNNEILLTNIRNVQNIALFHSCDKDPFFGCGSQFSFGTSNICPADINAALAIKSQNTGATKVGSFQMIYATGPTPEIPMVLNDQFVQSYNDAARVWENTSGKLPIPYSIFMRVAPMIWLQYKNAPAEVGTNDLRIYLAAGAAAANADSNTFYLMIHQLKSFRLLADGGVVQLTL